MNSTSEKRHVFRGYPRVDPFFGISIKMEVLLSQAMCHQSVLQHVAERCHAAKSLCCVSARIEAVFSWMLGLNASIVVDSDLPWWFRSVWAAHNKLHSADPTKCRAEAWNHGVIFDVESESGIRISLSRQDFEIFEVMCSKNGGFLYFWGYVQGARNFFSFFLKCHHLALLIHFKMRY